MSQSKTAPSYQIVQLPNGQQAVVQQQIQPQAVIQAPQVVTTMATPEIQAQPKSQTGPSD